MITAHDVRAVRVAERAALNGLPAGALMQRAAAGLAAVIAGELTARTRGVYGRRVVLLVGPGDNGGDALWAGARLAGRGAGVTAVLTSTSAHAEGVAGLLRAGGEVLDATADPAHGAVALAAADLVVDGLLGIGGRPGLREPAATLVADLDPTVPVVAVDLPSGVDPDTGEVAGVHVQAAVTVTFGTPKPCLLLPPANGAAGDVVVIDIGLDPARLGPPAAARLEPADVAARWPMPVDADDKYSRGVLGVVAGGTTYTGAAVLCAGAAVRCGAGMVRYVGPEPATDLVRASWPEVVPGPGQVQAWALGSGVDPDDQGQAVEVRAALDEGVPAVLDAGALEVLVRVHRQGRRPAGALLLTPHAGELSRLLDALDGPGPTRDDVEARPLHHARVAAGLTGATVLLKGATTLVVGPDGRVRAQPDGPHWLATAGSGDVLTGIAGQLLAAGLEPLEAGSLAVTVHGRAGTLASGGGPVSAGSVLDAVPRAVADLLGAGRDPGFATLTP